MQSAGSNVFLAFHGNAVYLSAANTTAYVERLLPSKLLPNPIWHHKARYKYL